MLIHPRYSAVKCPLENTAALYAKNSEDRSPRCTRTP